MPDALQLRVTGSFLATVMSRGFSIMTGLLPSPLSAVASAVNGIAAKIKNAKSVYAEVLFYIFAHEGEPFAKHGIIGSTFISVGQKIGHVQKPHVIRGGAVVGGSLEQKKM